MRLLAHTITTNASTTNAGTTNAGTAHFRKLPSSMEQQCGWVHLWRSHPMVAKQQAYD